MRILLIGGHQKLNFLTKSLKANGHDITIINDDYNCCELLSKTYEVAYVKGDGTDPRILEEAGASHMNAVIALCNKDSANLIICETAKKQFNVKNTYAIVNDPNNIKIFEELGVNKCISATQILTEAVEQKSIIDNLQTHFPMENGKVLVYETELNEKSPVLNKKLWEIGLPNESTVGFIIRNGQTIIPQGMTEFKNGDRVIILSSPEALEKITLLLTGNKS